jgi:DNA-binding MarR family transcriptional regulator
MADEFAPLNLRARLATLQDRIAQARASLEAHGIKGEQLAVLTNLIEKHDAIRGSLEDQATVTELHHSKASAQTDALESSFDRWLQNVENKFANPTGRKPSALV